MGCWFFVVVFFTSFQETQKKCSDICCRWGNRLLCTWQSQSKFHFPGQVLWLMEIYLQIHVNCILNRIVSNTLQYIFMTYFKRISNSPSKIIPNVNFCKVLQLFAGFWISLRQRKKSFGERCGRHIFYLLFVYLYLNLYFVSICICICIWICLKQEEKEVLRDGAATVRQAYLGNHDFPMFISS